MRPLFLPDHAGKPPSPVLTAGDPGKQAKICKRAAPAAAQRANDMQKEKKAPRFHYAWVICGACTLMLFIAMGLNSNVFTVYQPYILSHRGFSNTQCSLLITVRCLFSIAGMMTVERLCRRFSLRATVAAGALLEVCSRLVFAASSSFPAYCAASAMGGFAYSWAGTVPISLLIGRWFHARRGLAFGIGTTGSGIATIVMPPLITTLIEKRSLSFAFFTEAAITALASLVILLLIRDRPEALGMSAYTTGAEAEDTPRSAAPERPLSRAQWCAMLLAVAMLAGPAGPGFSHLTVHFVSRGIPSATVAWLMTYLGVALIFGKILCGHLTDRLGGYRSNFIIGGALLGGMLLCSLTRSEGLFLPAAAMTLLGVGLPMSSVSLAAWAQELCGDAGYETAVSRFTLTYAVGSFLFSAIPGILADRTGSYEPAYWLFTATAAACLVLVQRTYLKNSAAGVRR